MKKAVEMPGHGREENQKQVSLRRPQPLEIAKGGRFPHSHLSDDEAGWKSGNPKAGFPLSHRHEDIYGKPRKEAWRRIASSPFRLILRENQNRRSGSFLDENMLACQAL